MAEKPDPRIVYQIAATRPDQPESGEMRARIDYKPFHIGSGPTADLQLDDAAVLPIHARLFMTTARQIMLTNLGGQGTIILDRMPLASYASIQWKPGSVLRMGDYSLELVTLVLDGETGELEEIRPSVITQENAPVLVQDPGALFEGVFDGMDAEDDTEKGVTARPSAEAFVQAFHPSATPGRAVPPPEDSEDEVTNTSAESEPPVVDEMRRTPVMPFVPDLRPPAAAGGPPAAPPHEEQPSAMNTLPKDWQTVGKFSAQLTTNPVKLVVGERVRVPVSIRSEYERPLNLRLAVTGIPRAWVLNTEDAFTVGAGTITTLDLILQTQPPVNTSSMILHIRLSDSQSPEIALNLPLELVFKRDPNLVGGLEPAIARYPGRARLSLQNHTQAAIEVFIAGHATTPDLEVLPGRTQVHLPPGQTVKVPIAFAVRHRPWLRPVLRTFAVSATQGSRAPLDYTGTVQVRPRLPLIPTLIFAGVVAIVALLILFTGGGGPQAAASPQPTITATRTRAPTATTRPVIAPPVTTASATATQSPTATPSRTATTTPSPMPTLPFVDPRPAGCTEPIPSGWESYTVRSGDRVYRLSVDRGTTTDEIVRVNCLANPSQLTVGQVLLLPAP